MKNLVISNAGHALKTPMTVSRTYILKVYGAPCTESCSRPSLGQQECLSEKFNIFIDCVQNGHWEYCANGQKACFIEERKRRPHRGKERKVTSVHSGCKQLNACQVLFQVASSLQHQYYTHIVTD